MSFLNPYVLLSSIVAILEFVRRGEVYLSTATVIMRSRGGGLLLNTQISGYPSDVSQVEQ